MWHRIDDPDNPPPKDGTCVLLWGIWAGEINGPDDVPSVAVCYYSTGKSDFPGTGWWDVDGADAYASWMMPTHWMPLPPPPAEETP